MAGSAHMLYANLRRKRVRHNFVTAALRPLAQLQRHDRKRARARLLAGMRDARECVTPSGLICYFARGNLRVYYFDGGKP